MDQDNSEEELSAADYAAMRKPNRLYISKSTPAPFGTDAGRASRYARVVFDTELNNRQNDSCQNNEIEKLEREIVGIHESPTGRVQIQMHLAREQGLVREIEFCRIENIKTGPRINTLFRLDRNQSASFISAVEAMRYVEVEDCDTVRIDQQLIIDILSGDDGLATNYDRDPERFKALIRTDVTAEDVVALERRRAVVDKMQEWLTKPDVFEAEKASHGGRGEAVWQELLEENPWLLGLSLGTQVYTSWDKDKLERVVRGASVTGHGKRVDALMETNGAIQSMVFVEIKRHDTLLMEQEYRSGAWRPSKELTGGIVQVQQTAHSMQMDTQDFIHKKFEGEILTDGTFILAPRCFVLVGTLDQLVGEHGGPISDRVRSFEIFRRNINNPEIVTFDELYARARMHLSLIQHDTHEARVTIVDGISIDDDGVIQDDGNTP